MSILNVLTSVCFFSCLLDLAWLRTLSVTFNISLSGNELQSAEHSSEFGEMHAMPALLAEDRRWPRPKLSQEMIRSCMRDTETSMAQLKLFRLSLFTNYEENTKSTDYNDDDDGAGITNDRHVSEVDYISNPQMPFLDMKRNEPLQCFVRCLYERLGLINYDVLLEDAFKTQVHDIVQHDRPDIKECMDLESKNHCEAAYKLHLCFNHLKTLEAEQRIREVLERDNGSGSNASHNAEEDDSEDSGSGGSDSNNLIENDLKNSIENRVN